MRSLGAIATATENEVLRNAGVLGVVVTQILQRTFAFDPIFERLDTDEDVDDRLRT